MSTPTPLDVGEPTGDAPAVTRRAVRPGYCFKCEMLRKFKATEANIAADHARGHVE